MKKNQTSIPRRGSKPKPHFRAAMTKGRNDVLAALQLWGDFPDCNPQHCCSMDWQHVILSSLTDAFEQARLDECDSQIIAALKRKLAVTAAACEMWADNLEES